MHELAIAQAVADIALRHARGRPVVVVEVRIGRLRQVAPPALAFAWEAVAREAGIARARLAIVEVPVTGACRECGSEHELDGFPLRCPACLSLDVALLGGQELAVDAIEVEDAHRRP